MNLFKKRRTGFFLVVCVTLLLWSCGDDILNTDDYEIDRVTANPSIALPLAFGSVGISDFLDNQDQEHIRIYEDGLVYVFYEEKLVTRSVLDLLSFPDKSFMKAYPVVGGFLPATETENERLSVSSTENFGFDPEKLTEIKFKEGTSLTFQYQFTPDNPFDDGDPSFDYLDILIELPDFTLNGVPFSKRITTQSAPSVFSLEDYVANLDDNSFELKVTLIEREHDNFLVLPPSQVEVDLTFASIDFKYVRGFFGDQATEPIPAEAIKVEAFGDALNESGVSFADPRVTFTLNNEYGIPTTVDFHPLEARKSDGTALPLIFNVPNPVQTNAPTVLGESALTNISIANAADLLDFVPEEFYYEVSTRINEGLTSGENFCTDTSSLDVTMRVEIPLYGTASNIIMADTFEIDLSDVEDTEIESATLVSRVSNQLPLNADLQFYLTDDKYVIFDSLFAPNQTRIVKASTVDANGELEEAGVSEIDLEVSNEKLERLFEAKKLILKARLNTPVNSAGDPIDVQFKSDYKMDVNLGIKVKLKLDVSLNED